MGEDIRTNFHFPPRIFLFLRANFAVANRPESAPTT